ncbi:MAG: orotidine-5'-phosphate decarboxylase [Burkholderiales bacterium]|nr:orotidine-5'-phosphate decarboxylase [Burkholderiales bacterium]
MPDTESKSSTIAKRIAPHERLILPLDVPDNAAALALVQQLGDAVTFYKVGLELIIGGEFTRLVDELLRRGKKVMLDGKFFDVPETVRAAVRQAGKHDVTFVTVHGNDEMLRAAVAEKKGGMRILAVTVLTSLDDADLRDLGFQVDVPTLVRSRARRALELGCDGVVCSGQEAEDLRQRTGNQFLIVTPGIRPVKNVDDQKRTVDVEEAFQMGADYIVVGRPIRAAADPKQAAESVQARIARIFA